MSTGGNKITNFNYTENSTIPSAAKFEANLSTHHHYLQGQDAFSLSSNFKQSEPADQILQPLSAETTSSAGYLSQIPIIEGYKNVRPIFNSVCAQPNSKNLRNKIFCPDQIFLIPSYIQIHTSSC